MYFQQTFGMNGRDDIREKLNSHVKRRIQGMFFYSKLTMTTPQQRFYSYSNLGVSALHIQCAVLFAFVSWVIRILIRLWTSNVIGVVNISVVVVTTINGHIDIAAQFATSTGTNDAHDHAQR